MRPAAGEAENDVVDFIKLDDVALTTDQELLQSWQRMKDRKETCSKAEWARWQQAAGINFSAESFLLSQALLERKVLAPCTQYCHDFMHGMTSKGVLSFVSFWVLQALSEAGMAIWTTLRGYLEMGASRPEDNSLRHAFSTQASGLFYSNCLFGK